jgi:hypothetical protein
VIHDAMLAKSFKVLYAYDVNQVSLPTRTGPKYGTFAFDQEGEQQIYDAIRVHGLTKLEVAFRTGVSLVTIDAILRRVEQRQAA